jgi:hypothetical protein
LFDSNSSWQHIESDHDQQQQKQGLHSRIPEAQTDHGLTSQRLDDLQFDLSHNSHNDNVDHWERPYNPIHSQILVDSTNAMQPSDGNESSSSTMLPLSDYGRVDVVWDDPHGRYQQSQPVSNAPRPACSQRDFVEGNFARVIWLVGAPAAVKSLQQTVGEHMKKQWTSGQHQLCALYALEISLLAMYPNDPAAHANISFNSLLGIFQGVEYQQEAFRQAEVVRNAQVREELLSQTNLSVNAVLIILRILNRRMNENFALGVCTPSARGITDSALPEYSYDVHLQPTSSDSFYTRAVWIYNNKLDLDGSGSLKNHWSGFGYSTLTQNNTPMPHFCLNVKCVDAVSPNVEIDRSAACTPPSTAGSSYHLAGSPQFSNHSSSAYTSRMSSIEPDYGSYSGDKLSTRKPFIKHKSPSQSSRNSNKEQVQCEFCGKVIQKSGLR